MRTNLVILLSFFILPAFVFLDPAANKDFEKLYALEGKWIMKGAKRTIGEEWVKVDKNYLQNKGFYIKGEDTVVTERVALRNTPNGIFYTSTVVDQNDQQPVAFKLTATDGNSFTFENAAHDFPKRIVYNLISNDSLHAWIDGGITAPAKRQDFYFKKLP